VQRRLCACVAAIHRQVGASYAAAGVAARLLGTTRRANGALQVTYAGRPLYYYIGDRKRGQILCQNVTELGGVWRVIRPTGRLVG
jgi:predicted lipoprotein with Yx(FWY)xxD motif